MCIILCMMVNAGQGQVDPASNHRSAKGDQMEKLIDSDDPCYPINRSSTPPPSSPLRSPR